MSTAFLIINTGKPGAHSIGGFTFFFVSIVVQYLDFKLMTFSVSAVNLQHTMIGYLFILT